MVVPPGTVLVTGATGLVGYAVADRYLVADEHLSTRELAAGVLAAQGTGKKVPGVAPARVLELLASAMAPFARTFELTPLVAPGETQRVHREAPEGAGPHLVVYVNPGARLAS